MGKPIAPTKGSQEDIILRHIKRKKITAVQAFKEYNITDLAGRICRLKEKGWNIAAKRTACYDRNGKEITHWNEYRLVK